MERGTRVRFVSWGQVVEAVVVKAERGSSIIWVRLPDGRVRWVHRKSLEEAR